MRQHACVFAFLNAATSAVITSKGHKGDTAAVLNAMATPSAPNTPLTDKENVQDVSQTPEENIIEEKEDKTVDTVLVADAASEEFVSNNTDTSVTEDKEDDTEDGLMKSPSDGLMKDVDIEEGRTETEEPTKKRVGSVAPRSPSQMGRNPPPKRKPLWLYMLIIMVLAAFIGALIVTVVSGTRGEVSKVAMGFLIFFAIIIVCVAPIACYTRANFFALGMIHD